MSNFAQRFKHAMEAKKASIITNVKTAVKEAVLDAAVVVAQSLASDLVQLRALPVGETRNARKAELVENYRQCVIDYVADKSTAANPIFVNWIIWLVDLCRWEEVKPYATLAIEQNQIMPEYFNRDLKTFVCDAFVDYLKAGGKWEVVIFDWLVGYDVHAQIKAKLYRYAAEALQEEDAVLALTYATKALDLDQNVGVKKLISILNKKLPTK